MKDRREYVRVAVDLPENPKLADVDARAKWLYIAALCYAGRHLTDGTFPTKIVQKSADVAPKNLAILITRNVVHEPGHDCKTCEQPSPGWAVIHDYLDHQRSKDEAEESRSGKRRGADLTNHKRWHAEPVEGCRYCDRTSDQSSESLERSLNGRKARVRRLGVAEVEVEVEGEVENPIVQDHLSMPDRTGINGDRSVDPARIAAILGTDERWALRVIDQIQGQAPAEVRNPQAYVEAAIRKSPEDYRPTRTPPRPDQLCEHGRERATCPFEEGS